MPSSCIFFTFFIKFRRIHINLGKLSRGCYLYQQLVLIRTSKIECLNRLLKLRLALSISASFTCRNEKRCTDPITDSPSRSSSKIYLTIKIMCATWIFSDSLRKRWKRLPAVIPHCFDISERNGMSEVTYGAKVYPCIGCLVSKQTFATPKLGHDDKPWTRMKFSIPIELITASKIFLSETTSGVKLVQN